MKLHVLLKKEELDGERLAGKTVVILDILFATSSIVTALAHGVAEVIPARDGAAARDEAARRPPGACVLSGELNAETLPGFVPPTPLYLLAEALAGKTLVYSTTNGTVALGKAGAARHVYAAALLNGEAMAARIAGEHAGGTVLLVCAGSSDNFNLEDFYGAGYLVSLLAARSPGVELSDAALAALLLHDRCEAGECLRRARVGRLMLERRLEGEIDFAARKSLYGIVPKLDGQRLVAT
ncbi:MAG TPA: 2-phosphosulfolactate phosphatase [Candidatus Desulfobacillus sp.]|nr:2-phosphosulfolactate phosphatase [Candidatus Desulfobacillus sp.]